MHVEWRLKGEKFVTYFLENYDFLKENNEIFSVPKKINDLLFKLVNNLFWTHLTRIFLNVIIKSIWILITIVALIFFWMKIVEIVPFCRNKTRSNIGCNNIYDKKKSIKQVAFSSNQNECNKSKKVIYTKKTSLIFFSDFKQFDLI